MTDSRTSPTPSRRLSSNDDALAGFRITIAPALIEACDRVVAEFGRALPVLAAELARELNRMRR